MKTISESRCLRLLAIVPFVLRDVAAAVGLHTQCHASWTKQVMAQPVPRLLTHAKAMRLDFPEHPSEAANH